MFLHQNNCLKNNKLNRRINPNSRVKSRAYGRLVPSVSLSLFLLACGGGGGGSSEGASDGTRAQTRPGGGTASASERPPITPRAAPPDWQTDKQVWADNPEFQAQQGLATINAHGAYAKGATGAGVTIGFVDTGLDEAHEEFADKRVRLNDRSGVSNADAQQLSHGTGVASIALGARGSGDGMHGVAFDADIAMWSLNLDQAGFLDVNDRILSYATLALQQSGARIINQSWGYETLLDPSLSDTQRHFLSGSYGGFIDEMRRGEAIHVWAAGNSGGDEISVSTAWPLLFPELAGLSITVAALGGDGAISYRSNRCGVAKNHCLVAPGGVAAGSVAYTRMARSGGNYRTASGTSYAAPYVAGVLGLMQQTFGDQLSLPEYTARLFATAKKDGIYADEMIYGQGLVDADAAISPVGELNIPLPAGGIMKPRDGFIEGGELPEEMLQRLRRERIIVLDELNAPFATRLAVKPDKFQSFALTEWMTHGDNKTAPYSHPTLASFAELFDGAPLSEYWQLVPLAMRHNSLNGNHLPQFGFGFTARRTRRRTRLELGLLTEDDSLMGTSGAGALKLGDAHTALFGYGHDFDLGETHISFDTHFTVSHSEGDTTSLVKGTSGALASAFTLQIERGDMHLALKQPTFFELGVLRLNVPVKRLAGGGVVFEPRDFKLRADHRPFELSLSYGAAASGRIGFKMETQGGHDVKAGLGYFRRF